MFIAGLDFYKKLSKQRSCAIADFILPLMDKEGADILDFGAGNMWLAERIVERNSGAKVTGIDVIEDQNLDREILANPRISFQVYNSRELPYNENTFDYAIASAVMHHTPDPEYYLSELKRIIKPGGSVILVEEMYHNEADKIYIMAEDYILNKLKKGVPVPLHFRRYSQYKEEFKKLEFQVEYEGFVRPNFPWKHHYVFKLRK